MKCITCGSKKFSTGFNEIEGQVRGDLFKVTMNAPVCMKCGNASLEGKAVQEFMRLVSDEYRIANSLLTSREIRATRGVFSQKQFADRLGVGVASIKRWELGAIQDYKSDRLLREYQNGHCLSFEWCGDGIPVAAAADEDLFPYAA